MTSALNDDRQHEKGENRRVLAVGRGWKPLIHITDTKRKEG